MYFIQGSTTHQRKENTMGASFTIFLLTPIMLFILIPETIFGFITGNDRTEFILPYEPENGIVWECNYDDEIYQLAKTETKGNEQIFYIRPKSFGYHDSQSGEFSSIIFTDKNGNEKKYYVCNNTNTPQSYDLSVYAPGEYYDFDYTVKAEKPSIFSSWYVAVADSEYVLYNPDTNNAETTFTVVHPFDKYERETYWISFSYGSSGNSKEGITITYKITDNGAEIIDESHRFYD